MKVKVRGEYHIIYILIYNILSEEEFQALEHARSSNLEFPNRSGQKLQIPHLC